MSDKFNKISDYAKVIAKKPNTRSTYFYLDEQGQMMMILSSKLSNLPRDLDEMKKREHGVLFIDLENSKSIRWLAYDVDDPIKETFKNELEGVVPWDWMEDAVLEFFEKNVRDLCHFTNPNEELERIINKHSTPSPVAASTYFKQSSYDSSNRNANHYRNNYDPNAYSRGHDTIWGQSYKDREAFVVPLYKLINEGKTGQAIDYISDKISLLLAENKFDSVNSILQFIEASRLDLLTKLCLLKATQGYDAKLYERKFFYTRIKTHFEGLQSVLGRKLFDELEQSMKAPLPALIENPNAGTTAVSSSAMVKESSTYIFRDYSVN